VFAHRGPRYLLPLLLCAAPILFISAMSSLALSACEQGVALATCAGGDDRSPVFDTHGCLCRAPVRGATCPTADLAVCNDVRPWIRSYVLSSSDQSLSDSPCPAVAFVRVFREHRGLADTSTLLVRCSGSRRDEELPNAMVRVYRPGVWCNDMRQPGDPCPGMGQSVGDVVQEVVIECTDDDVPLEIEIPTASVDAREATLVAVWPMGSTVSADITLPPCARPALIDMPQPPPVLSQTLCNVTSPADTDILASTVTSDGHVFTAYAHSECALRTPVNCGDVARGWLQRSCAFFPPGSSVSSSCVVHEADGQQNSSSSVSGVCASEEDENRFYCDALGPEVDRRFECGDSACRRLDRCTPGSIVVTSGDLCVSDGSSEVQCPRNDQVCLDGGTCVGLPDLPPDSDFTVFCDRLYSPCTSITVEEKCLSAGWVIDSSRSAPHTCSTLVPVARPGQHAGTDTHLNSIGVTFGIISFLVVSPVSIAFVMMVARPM
jgi:hypothetical protein